MEYLLQAKNIVRDFPSSAGTVRVLKGISLDIEHNTLNILRGRSGSGKTTLMNILGTLDEPTEGDVLINGKSILNIPAELQDQLRSGYISFVFQSVALIGSMTAYENVEFMLRIAGKPLDRERILHCLNLVGLEERANHMPFQLSGGEQQRVAIARAIVGQPKLLFADEPTAQLDSKTSLIIMKLFHELIKREGCTVVMTTHDQNMMELADKVYTLEDGQISDCRENRGEA